jgi:type II secretory pathway pseudopilin PulG
MRMLMSQRAGPGRPRNQRGWSLLESAVATALLGVLVVATLSATDPVRSQEDYASSAELLARAEDAVLGFALAHDRFPMPLDARPSPGHPGAVEGRFPASIAGMSFGPLRYLVDESLTRAPEAHYRPDPLGLAGDLIAPRQAANGLDLCATLLAANRSLAFGLRVDETEPAWHGHAESATHLGCLEKLSRLAVAVKATVAAADLGRLADQNVAFRTLLVDNAETSMTNLHWQQANLGAGLTRFALDAVQHVVQLKSTPVVLAKETGTLASIAAGMAATAVSLEQNRVALDAARAKLPQVRQQLEAAVRHAQAVKALVQGQTARSNRLLQQG